MLKKKKEYTSLKKATLFICIIAFFLTETARNFYRPYIYKKEIFDYYISDTIGNSLGTVTAVFMILTLVGKGHRQDWKIIVIVILGLIGYELLNIVSSHPFDFKDVLATIIFGGMSFALYFYLLKAVNKRE